MARAIQGEYDAEVERGTENRQTQPFWLVVATLGMASLLGALNNMSLNAFLPLIAEDFRRSVPAMGQITTVVAILGAMTGLVVGPLADRYGQRRFLLIGGAAIGGALISFGGYEVLGLGLAGFIVISGLLVWRPIGGKNVSEVVPEGNQA